MPPSQIGGKPFNHYVYNDTTKKWNAVAFGQATMSESIPVVLASDHSSIPITATITGTPNVNVAQYGGVAVGADNAIHIQPGTGATFPISAVSLPLPAGAATASNQQTDALTDTELRAAPVPVSGPLTDAQLRATDVPVDTGLTQPTTPSDTQPVSGTVTANLGTIADVATQTTLALIKAKTDNLDTALSGIKTGTDKIIDAPATEAKQDTGNTSLAAINTALQSGGISQTQFAAMVTALQTIDDIVGAIKGPGSPTIDSFTSDDVNLAANTANQSVIAAPGASKQIWVYGLTGTADVAGSISIQDEDDTALSGVMPVSATGGFVMNPSGNFAMPWIKVATNKALEIDTVTCAFDGIIIYAIVSV